MAESVCIHTYLGLECSDPSQNFHHPRLKRQSVVIVIDEFHFHPFLTINYTNSERLEGLRCFELLESVSTHSIWLRKVDMGHAKFVPTHDQKIGCGGHFRPHIQI